MNESDTAELSVSELATEIESSITDGGSFIRQCATDYETRQCLWTGQSDDGKKRAENLDAEPFPWEGASDARIRLADEVVNDNVRIKRAAMKRALLQAAPVESGDTAAAGAVTTFMRWLMGSLMQENLRREIPLLANWDETYSCAVLAVTWDEEQRVRKRTVEIEEIVAAVTEVQQAAAQMPDDEGLADQAMQLAAGFAALLDPTMENEAGAWLQTLFSDLKPRQAKRAAVKLRDTGTCVVPEFYTARKQPLWTAGRVYRDVFFPANTVDLQRAPWIAWRNPMSEAELKGRIVTDDYDPALVDEALKQKGSTLMNAIKIEVANKSAVDDMKDLVELYCVYRKVVDAEGYQQIRVTEFVPGMEDPLAEYDLNYAHGLFPFVYFSRDRTERLLIENRSVPSLVETHQQELKNLRDFRSDRLSITILPPVEVPMARKDDKLMFGPAVRVPMRRPGEISFMRTPQHDPDTVALERQVRLDVDNFFGRLAEGVNPARSQLYQQATVDEWLGGLQLAAKMTLALVGQYMPEEFQRVTGQAYPEGAEYDVLLDFNAADLNMEYVLKKLNVMKEVLAMDTQSVVNRPVITEWAMRSIDPMLGAKAVMDVQVANDRETSEEQDAFTKIMAGTEPAMREGGQNFALRLRVLQDILQRNPDIQAALQDKPTSLAMLQARMKHLEFQVQQEQNANIGRLGAVPALG